MNIELEIANDSIEGLPEYKLLEMTSYTFIQ